MIGRPPRPVAERLLKRVVPSEGCWIWPGHLNNQGYGIIVGDDGKERRTHRVAYEVLVGPIPEGLELDHLCRVRACLRPDHLEPVTHTENVRRGLAAQQWTECKQGHPLVGENVYTQPSNGKRRCKECQRIRDGARSISRGAA